MKLDLISFETAKLAKKKGVDLQWNGDYISDYSIFQKYWYDSKGEKQCVPRQGDWGLSDFLLPRDEYYLAPSQALLQKWLKEEHDIYVFIEPYVKHYSVKYICHVKEAINTDSENLSLEWRTSFTGEESYEEALKAGLQEALKLIKLHNDEN